MTKFVVKQFSKLINTQKNGKQNVANVCLCVENGVELRIINLLQQLHQIFTFQKLQTRLTLITKIIKRLYIVKTHINKGNKRANNEQSSRCIHV